jgi:hypothetical protein
MFSNDGEKVLMEDLFKKLFWYDIKKRTRRIVENDEHISNKFWTWTFVANLLLLDGDSDALLENPKLLHQIFRNQLRMKMIYSLQPDRG